MSKNKLENAFCNFFNKDLTIFWDDFPEDEGEQISLLAFSFLFWMKVRVLPEISSDEEMEKTCVLHEARISLEMTARGLRDRTLRKVTHIISLETRELDGKERKEALIDIDRCFEKRTGSAMSGVTMSYIRINNTVAKYVEDSMSRMITWNLVRDSIIDDERKMSIYEEFYKNLVEEFRIRNIESEVKEAIYAFITGGSVPCDTSKDYEEILQGLRRRDNTNKNEIRDELAREHSRHFGIEVGDYQTFFSSSRTEEEEVDFNARELIFWMKENNFSQIMLRDAPIALYYEFKEGKKFCEWNINLIETRCRNKGIADKVEARFNELAKLKEKGHVRVCNFCCIKHNIRKCSRCKLVYYCSSKCQREDWKRHKKRCIREVSSA